jgi:hypothetical protein
MTVPTWSPSPISHDAPEQLVCCLAKIYSLLAIVVEHRTDFLPGEACEELANAWKESEPLFQPLVDKIALANADLDKHGLMNATGLAKINLVSRLYDEFLSHWTPTPKNSASQERAAQCASDTLEFGSTLLGSVCECFGVSAALQELVQLFKQSIGIAMRRNAVGAGKSAA